MQKFRSIASVALLATSVMVESTDAYSVVPPQKTREAKSSSSAIGYTMEMPDFSTGLPKSTWYDVANPTARRIVYDDGPSEITFAMIGSNWPDLEEDDSIPEPTPSRARQTLDRINPIWHAKNLIRWVL
jgi:hypothetical protein